MDRFVAVAIDQARASYLACSVAATAALLVLLAGATTVLTVQGTTGQIVAGTLTGVGAALSSFLSVTFLRTFQMTSASANPRHTGRQPKRSRPSPRPPTRHEDGRGARRHADATAGNAYLAYSAGAERQRNTLGGLFS